MNIDQITPDDFMKMSTEDHAVAISLYSKRIILLQSKATRPENADALEIMLDEVRRCQNLRKVHVQAAYQLEFDQPAAATETETEAPTAATETETEAPTAAAA